MAVYSFDNCYGGFSESDFVTQSDGVYTLTIAASTHSMGTSYRVSKITRIVNNEEYPVLIDYKIASNGDFILTVNEKFSGRYYLSVGG